jgi:hypothetical protein
MKIYYKNNNGDINTSISDCSHYPTKIISSAINCQACKYFVSINREQRYVICKYTTLKDRLDLIKELIK